jgi:hypothetical protein
MQTPSFELCTYITKISRSIFSVSNHASNKFTTLTALVLVLFLMGCSMQNKNKLLIEKFLFSDTEIGTISKLSSSGIDPTETVCVLKPYQYIVHDDHPERLRINEYLRQIDYKPNEGSWSLVMVSELSIELLRFTRSSKADISGLSPGMKNALFPQPPTNFEIAECVSYEQATLFKTQLNDRVYVLFGRTK